MQRTTAVYLGETTALTKTVYGHKMFVDTRDLGITPHLLLDGYWENWITDEIGNWLRNSVFFDVGANMGWYTLLAGKQEAHAIFAFEPNEVMWRLLVRSCQVNGLQATVKHWAVSDVAGEASLRFDPEFFGNGSLFEQKQDSTLSHEVVPVIVLDEFQEYWGRPDLAEYPVVLKVDVEGFEPRVILGARKLLQQRNCVAFVEYHPDPDGTNRLSEMLALFEELGYRMKHIQQRGALRNITKDDLASVPSADMLLFYKY